MSQTIKINLNPYDCSINSTKLAAKTVSQDTTEEGNASWPNLTWLVSQSFLLITSLHSQGDCNIFLVTYVDSLTAAFQKYSLPHFIQHVICEGITLLFYNFFLSIGPQSVLDVETERGEMRERESASAKEFTLGDPF